MYFKQRTRSYWSWLFGSSKPRTKSGHEEHSSRVDASLDAVVAAINAAAEKNIDDGRPDRRL